MRVLLSFALGGLLGLVLATGCAWAAEWCIGHPSPTEPTSHLLLKGQAVA